MLHIVLFFLLTMFNNCDKYQMLKYSNAYKYVVNNDEKNIIIDDELAKTDNNIFISDSIVFINPFALLDKIVEVKYDNKLSKEQFEKIKMDEYLELDEKSNVFKGYTCNVVNDLNKDREQDECDLILFFSEVYSENFLFAELFPYTEGESNLSIDEIRRFNKSIVYVFYFNENSELLSTYSVHGQYD